MASEQIERGDWVQVWARVEGQDRAHPEDLRVQVDSHNASPEAVFCVRRDWVTKPDTLPEFAEVCTHLYYDDITRSYLRCVLHSGHAVAHKNGSMTWNDLGTVGYFEAVH